MPAQIITVTSLKGGVGKTTTTYALAAAAVAQGLRVICLDLDPTGGLSNTLEKRGTYPATIYDVLQGRVSLRDGLVSHPLGRMPDGRILLRTVPSDRRLVKKSGDGQRGGELTSVALIKSVIAPLMEEVDFVLIDTHPSEALIMGPLEVADIVVIPTKLDILSLRGGALTVALADSMGMLSKLKGLVVTDAKRPLAELTRQLLGGLQMAGLSFETVLWFTVGWVKATSGKGELPEERLLEEAKQLLHEVLTRPAPVANWQGFLQMARKPAVKTTEVRSV